MLKIYDFSVDYAVSPTLVKCKDLRFRWKLKSDLKNVVQKGYQITIFKSGTPVFDSGFVASSDFFDIDFRELCLESRTDYVINLTVEDNYCERATYSHTVSTEILPDEWEAVWIKPAVHISGWAPYLRTKFEVSGIRKAVMYACGLGCAEYYVNGVKTDDFMIDPPSSNYDKIVYYRRFDVTGLLKEGGNALAVWLGEGFYSQSRVWGYEGLKYGDVCCILRLEITLEDGSQKVITSNTDSWEYKYSPVTVNNLYGGETYDCRLETKDFCDYYGSGAGWSQVVEDTAEKGVLTPCLIPAIKVIRQLPATEMHCASGKDDGAWIFDMGENISGVAEFTIPRSPRGAVYVFRYAETLDASGHLDFRSTGAFATQCIQQDIYICRGDEEGEVYRPRFTYHGFRYVEVTGFHDFTKGYGTMPQLSLVKGLQVATSFRDLSDFESSYEDLNRLYRIMKNTFVSNYHGHPEDCPAREKCGWLGDAHIVCDFGLLNFDTVVCYNKYLLDMRTSHEHYGELMQIAPGLRTCGDAMPLWGCAQILIPYFLYKYSGDTKAITGNFDLMEMWVRHEEERSEDYVISAGLGDWIPPCKNKSPRRMPVKHSSTAIFYEICTVMAQICEEFQMGDAGYYSDLAQKIRESFNRHFYDFKEHTYGYWATDAVALETGLCPENQYSALLNALITRIKEDDYFMSTAIYGNKYLMPLLFKEGYGDIALKCLFGRKYPSFGTMLDDGATTLYEDISVKSVADYNGGHASLNHPMHGGFLYLLTTELCGMKPLAPGYKVMEFSPCFTAEIETVKAEFELTAGKFGVQIKNSEKEKICSLRIPAGATCVLNVNGEVTVDGETYIAGSQLGSGEHRIIMK